MSKITGKVVDYNTDAGILGVLVQGVASDGTIFTSTTTDNSGSYTLDNAGFDSPYAKISFNKEGYAATSMRPQSANNVDVVLAPANTLAAVTLTLKRDPKKALLFALIGAAIVYLAIKYRKQLKLS